MIERVLRRLLVLGIVIAASGCDNVSWGGIDLRLEGPGAEGSGAGTDTLQAPPTPEPTTSLGPILYAGVRDGDRARVVPVAEITPEGLQPLYGGPRGTELIQEVLRDRLRPGAELTLFHEGARIGTLEVEEGEMVEDPYCQPRARGSGSILLLPQVAGTQRFLALEPSTAPAAPLTPYRELASTYEQRVASLNLGAEAIPLVGATWPPSLLDIRQDLRILDLPGGEDPAVLATFVYRDRLQTGSAPDDAWSLMVLGEPRGGEFRLAWTWYRPVGTQGKGGPRYFSRLDWDGDGEEEILLEVLGAESLWFAALHRGPEGWRTLYQDPCGAPRGQGAGG